MRALLAKQSPSAARHWLGGYYLVTPGFVLLDWALGIPLRAPFFDEPALRYGYYALCLLLGGAVYWRPRWAAAIGLTESALAVFLLVASIVLAVVRLPGDVVDGSAPEAVFGPMQLVSFVLFGTMAVLSFKSSERQLGRHFNTK